MARVNRASIDVPADADERLDELAQILARGVLRLETRKSGCDRQVGLEVSAKTRLNVARSNGPERTRRHDG